MDKPILTLRAVETGAGEPVLFLHGFGLTTAHWAPLLARLPSRQCISIDMPGHGASDPMDYRGVNLRDWFGNMLTSCLDRMGVESVDVVGHSQGAMIGMLWTRRSGCGRWLRSGPELDAPAAEISEFLSRSHAVGG